MTSASAERLGLGNRGRIRVGWTGDAVLFDPATFCDTATFEEPCQHPVGLKAVVMDGRLVLEDGRMIGERMGRFRRPATAGTP